MNIQNNSNSSLNEIQEEQQYIQQVITSFQTYFLQTQQWLQHQISMFLSLNDEEKKLLPQMERKWKCIINATVSNQLVLNEIIQNQSEMIQQNNIKLLSENEQKKLLNEMNEKEKYQSLKQFDKVKSMLTHLYRDWSVEGKQERLTCYTPLLNELNEQFPNDENNEKRKNIKILVPGAGLGRLAYEIASMGFNCEGNEFSYFMLFTSYYILNGSDVNKQQKIFPWILETCNLVSFADQMRQVTIPDIQPDLGDRQMSMVAGDFTELYQGKNEEYDSLVSCFFIDTAHNIIEYIRLIHSVLKKNGVWINEGPLLYHFSGDNSLSIELTWEEVKSIIVSFGFVIEKEKIIQTRYCQRPHSLLDHIYNTIYFVARKQ